MVQSTTARLIRVILLAGIGYFFFVFHGLSSHLNPWSQALINAMVKFTYPTTGQEEITVLLFREENLKDLGSQYPVPYQLHADILEALASYGPKAVFVDFAFVDQRDDRSLEQLSTVLCQLRDAGSEVFLATPLAGDGQPQGLAPLLRCARPVMPEMDEKTAESGVLTYFHGRQTPAGFVPSAAFAMAGTSSGMIPEQAEKLEIIWGKGVDPFNQRWMECREKLGAELLAGILSDNPLSARLNCPYHRTITVNHLLNSIGDGDIESALRGKTVLYGAGFRFTGDTVESPVYGEMPGVYLHAMAFDNLLSFRQDYKRSDRNGLLVKSIDLAVLLAAAALLVFFPAHENAPAGTLTEFVARAGRSLVAIVFAAAVLGCALTWWGMDIACLAAVALYLGFRIAVQRDCGFFWLTCLTASTTVFCYMVLDIGPRNILAFIAFYEVVGHLQEKLMVKAQEYRALRQQIAPTTTAPGIATAAWNMALDRFFWIFQPTVPKPMEIEQ